MSYECCEDCREPTTNAASVELCARCYRKHERLVAKLERAVAALRFYADTRSMTVPCLAELHADGSFTWPDKDPWIAYVARLPNRELADALEGLMACLKVSLRKGVLPRPTAIPDESGSAIHLAWDRGDHHLEIDMASNGSFEWFYRNRRTNEIDGTEEEPERAVGDALARRLELVAR